MIVYSLLVAECIAAIWLIGIVGAVILNVGSFTIAWLLLREGGLI